MEVADSSLSAYLNKVNVGVEAFPELAHEWIIGDIAVPVAVDGTKVDFLMVCIE